MRRLRMVGGQEVLYGKIKAFIRDYLFGNPVDLDDLNVLRNLSKPLAGRALLETFATAVNELTIVDSGVTHVVSESKLTKLGLRSSVISPTSLLPRPSSVRSWRFKS
ncbi:MAG: hypothetical protein WAN48_05835 [Actinomycetes bacterium]